MVFWGFSGRAPGAGGSIEPGEELARWRSSTFAALNSPTPETLQVVFKSERGDTNGLYLREGLVQQFPLATVAEVGTTSGTAIDPQAPAESLVSAVGIERDGFRNHRLAITVSMLFVDPVDPKNTLGWAGIYQASVPLDGIFIDGFED